MNVKRYEWVSCDEHACHCDVVESAEGDMVDYEDYAALEARCAALAAENVGLKSAIEKHADSYIMCGYCRTERDGKNDDVCEVLDSIPATDALLAEVRAQGVEMFAAHKRERQQALRSRSMRMSEEAAGMAADAENFADELRKGVQS
ncbi:hypothetical protein [Enterobacter hormaechei]|uniref:hypothetical protein n=1 Tax=Enterobacter hormaechei TaxID=158836 RepID=UPI001CE07107|nr:hypothetical protein [Enterobacter hormaechei]